MEDLIFLLKGLGLIAILAVAATVGHVVMDWIFDTTKDDWRRTLKLFVCEGLVVYAAMVLMALVIII